MSEFSDFDLRNALDALDARQVPAAKVNWEEQALAMLAGQAHPQPVRRYGGRRSRIRLMVAAVFVTAVFVLACGVAGAWLGIPNPFDLLFGGSEPPAKVHTAPAPSHAPVKASTASEQEPPVPNPVPSATEAAFTLKPGTYVRAAYLSSLKKTHSPLKSSGENSVGAALLKRHGTGVTIQLIHNFHEGEDARVVEADGVTHMADADLEGSYDALHLDIESEEAFAIVEPKKYAGGFVRIDDFKDLVRRYTVAGTWLDEAGLTYRFKENGTAVFPDRSIDYWVITDHVTDVHFDAIYVDRDSSGGPGCWGFELEGDELRLYETSGDYHGVRADEPFLRLQRSAD